MAMTRRPPHFDSALHTSIVQRCRITDPRCLPQVSVWLRRQYAFQVCMHFQAVCAGNPSDVDSEQGPQLTQFAVELRLIRRT